MLISLRDRLVLVFFGITVLAFAALYLYVSPGLHSRLLDDRLHGLAISARAYSGPVGRTVGTSASGAVVRGRVDAASRRSQMRVTLLAVSMAAQPSGPQLTTIADSGNPNSTSQLGDRVAWQAIHSRRLATGTETNRSGIVAEAALPVSFQGRVARVIMYSTPASDVLRTVTVVRQQILVAGAIALLLSLIGGYLLARWLTQRVKRLEQAAERVAGGEFEHPLAVDVHDELGQLTVAFNDMQRQLGLLDKARKQFIATASHELRTPVFSLGGFVELLEDEELDPATRRRFLGHVSEQVERLRKLSVDLLDLSRLESGSLELRPEAVDLGELTRSVSAEFEVSLAQHDSRLELRLPRQVEAMCDPVRIAQIVRILIDNAVTHTPVGTNIVVTAGRSDGTVRLAVRDNGCGIDEGAMPRIFEPFFTADDAQGSGLGLAIASELAERMDGRLDVDCRPGETVFTLEIPA
jgi:signal transduction histidine kinase